MIPFFLFIVWFLKRDPIIFNWFTSISFPSFHSFKEAWCTRSLLVHLIFLYFIKSYSLIPFSLSWRRWLWRRSSVSIVVIFLMPVPGTKIRRPAREWNVKGLLRQDSLKNKPASDGLVSDRSVPILYRGTLGTEHFIKSAAQYPRLFHQITRIKVNQISRFVSVFKKKL